MVLLSNHFCIAPISGLRAAKGAPMQSVQSVVQPEPTSDARHRGPSLVIVATVYAVLVLGGVIVPTAVAGGQHFPSPFAPEAPRWFAEYPLAARLSALLFFGSTVPLGIFTATASSRLQFFGMRVAGVQIALFGGFAASVALA